MASTACFREVDPVEVPVEVISESELLERQLEDSDDEDIEQWERRQRAYALLALEPDPDYVGYETTTEQWIATVSALYYSDDDRVVIVDRGRPLDSGGAVSTLVHEYSHALQNRLGLAARPPTRDGRMARSAMIEGDATLTEDRARLSMSRIDEDEVPWDHVFDDWQEYGRDSYDSVRHKIVLASRYFTYPFGLEWAHQRFREGGRDAVEALLDEFPASTRQVVAGPDAPAPPDGWRDELNDVGKPQLSERYALLEAEQWGRWVFQGFLDAVVDEAPDVSQMDGADLRSDMLTLWMDVDGEAPLAVWRLRFEDGHEADAMAESVDGIELEQGLVHAYHEGRDAIVIGSPDRETAEQLVGELTWGPVPDSSMPSDEMRPGPESRVACWLPAAQTRAPRP